MLEEVFEHWRPGIQAVDKRSNVRHGKRRLAEEDDCTFSPSSRKPQRAEVTTVSAGKETEGQLCGRARKDGWFNVSGAGGRRGRRQCRQRRRGGGPGAAKHQGGAQAGQRPVGKVPDRPAAPAAVADRDRAE